jgi:membrane-associated phospholipid phosphatase
MAIPYILFVPIFWLIFIYAYLTQNKQFKVLALTIIIVHLISYLFYVFYQTHIPRPSIHGTGFALDLVRFIYSHDAPYNGFPSLHSALAAIMAMYFVNTRWGILYIGFALVVVLSTLFIKQHFIADAVAGVLLGVTIYLLVQHKIYNKSYERK